MTLRRWLFAVIVVSGCGPLEIGSYPSAESDASGGTTAQGGEASGAGSPSLGGVSTGGNANGGSNGGSAGFPDTARGGSSGDGGSAVAGGGFAGGLAGSGFGGTAGTPGDSVGGAGTGGANGDSSTSGSSGSFAGGGLGGSAASGGSGGGGFGGGSAGRGGSGGILDQSCRGLEGQCSEHFNCCNATYVDTEEFVLGWDQFAVNARITKFYPDLLEVTVGRFANFVNAYEEWRALGYPRAGAGEHPFIPGTGWQTDFPLPESRDALEEGVTGCAFVTTYPFKDAAPELPMNCVSWFEAFAFCIWDGKRLMTEAEWELAAKGGSKDRVYPWGNDPEPAPELAVYGCFGAGLGAPHCEAGDILAVGSKPLGNSWHGLRDTAGSVAEWVFDKEGPYADPCIDCANIENEDHPNYRMFRGGGYSSAPVVLATERRNYMEDAQRLDFVGFRCARSLLYPSPSP